MELPLKIREILRVSEQGCSRSFLCKDEKGDEYWCKGEGLDKNRILVPVRLPSQDKPDVYNAAMIAFEKLQGFTRTVDETDVQAEKEEVLAFAS